MFLRLNFAHPSSNTCMLVCLAQKLVPILKTGIVEELHICLLRLCPSDHDGWMLFKRIEDHTQVRTRLGRGSGGGAARVGARGRTTGLLDELPTMLQPSGGLAARGGSRPAARGGAQPRVRR